MNAGTYKTEQEDFWAGEFGNEYIGRNDESKWIASRTHMFAEILGRTRNVGSFLELGANVGQNLMALRQLRPQAVFSAVEINDNAFSRLEKLGWVEAHHGSLLEKTFKDKADFVFTSGVLIHINPDFLSEVYESMYAASRRYICVIEYFNPSPVAILYRGHQQRLFKRDFAGEMMDTYPALRLVDYGFVYSRDSNFPLDNLNWFLLEKT